jgi:tRNA(Ile)-lysidine synthase
MNSKKNEAVFFAFQDFLESQKLKDKKILLQVSGGVDSMVLLAIASKFFLPEKIAVFHLDHQARKNSDEDLLFVQNICSKKGVQFYGERVQQEICKNKEALWRKIRIEKARAAAKDFGAERILTAHHATDLVETMIFRLTKGCGPEGLSPFDTTTKPFWNIPKSDLVSYAQKNKISWREDASNLNKKFKRNKIRHEILPILRTINPNLEKVFIRESEIFKGAQLLIEEALGKAKPPLDLKIFQAWPKTLKTTFLRKNTLQTPSFSEIEDALKWLDHKPKGGSEKMIGGEKFKILNQKIIIVQSPNYFSEKA